MTLFDEAALPGPLRRVVLHVAYDGTGFRGFAAQGDQRTVAGVLESALETVAGVAARVTCAGRTDAGVHALAQVVHVDLPDPVLAGRFGPSSLDGELPRLAKSLSSLVGPDCVVWAAHLAPDGFDARRSAVLRRYRYEIDAGPFQSPLRRDLAWHVEGPLDLAAMRLASDALLGEHDFAGFCRQPPDGEGGRATGPIRRRVLEARWLRPVAEHGGAWIDQHATSPETLVFEIAARSFCHQMVRSIVGSLVAIGAGRLRSSDLAARVRSAHREGAPPIAPACGLRLVEVRYPPELGGSVRFTANVS